MKALVRYYDTPCAIMVRITNTCAEGGQGGKARLSINDEQRHRASHEGDFQFLHETSGRRQWHRTFHDGFDLMGGGRFHAGV